jgi:hypothetical protein
MCDKMPQHRITPLEVCACVFYLWNVCFSFMNLAWRLFYLAYYEDHHLMLQILVKNIFMKNLFELYFWKESILINAINCLGQTNQAHV